MVSVVSYRVEYVLLSSLLSISQDFSLSLSFADGRVVFRALPHPKDPAMLTAQLVEKQVKFVDDQTGAFKMTGAIRVSE